METKDATQFVLLLLASLWLLPILNLFLVEFLEILGSATGLGLIVFQLVLLVATVPLLVFSTLKVLERKQGNEKPILMSIAILVVIVLLGVFLPRIAPASEVAAALQLG